MGVIELFKYYFYLGSTCFGGPLAIIANMRSDLVEKKKLVTEKDFEDYFGYSQIAPGPIAFQVCLYISYFNAGLPGAIAGGVGLVLPSFFLVLLFSIFYSEFTDTEFVRAALYGISPVIISIILYSGLQLAGRVFKKNYLQYFLFIVSILVTVIFKFPIIYTIICAGLLSLIFHLVTKNPSKSLNSIVLSGLLVLVSAFTSVTNYFKGILAEINSRLLDLALLFMKVGALTYGSGFVIVGVLNQEVVQNYGFITAKEFIDGLAFGQITPGPVVITSTFIGYLSEGFLGAVVCTVCIFLPTFLLVVVLARFMKRISNNFYVKSIIKGANAAAIGAILATAYSLSSEAINDLTTIILFIVSLVCLFFLKIQSLYLIVASAIIGLTIYAIGTL